MLLLQGALNHFEAPGPTRLNAVIGLAFLLGWTCSAIGLRQVRATGRGVAALVLLMIQLTGLGLAALQEVQDFIYTSWTPDTIFYDVCNAAWPISVVFMLVVEGFVLSARVMSGWQRWTPGLCGLAVPLLIAIGSLLGRRPAVVVFGLYTCVAWAMLGAAVRSE
jgi:hypothetical protein